MGYAAIKSQTETKKWLFFLFVLLGQGKVEDDR